VAAVLVAVVVALPLGVIGAVFREGPIDRVTSVLSLAGISVPVFWLGPMLALVFAVELGWLPVSGRGTWAQLVLPAVTLGAALAAGLARMTRASVGSQLDERYVAAAHARGLPAPRAVYHAFRNSLIPVVTILGLQLGVVLTGTVITETIFAWPGVGRLLIQAIYGRDYPLVQGCILFIAVTYVAMNLLVDVAYAWLDPRVRLR
jgi:ABC-type dipeptide/oligopeptide/nickel transport system permease component